MRRHPERFPLLAVFALPFRLPISADGRTVNLLVPLYLVVAAGTLALPAARGCCEARAARPRARRARRRRGPRPARASPVAVAARAGVAAARPRSRCTRCRRSTPPTTPRRPRTSLFFYIPFGLLFVLLREVRWTRELLLRVPRRRGRRWRSCSPGSASSSTHRKALFLNPKVVAANQYDNYFRVNSLFFDPSIYGRFLALVMIAVTTVVLWSARRRERAGRRGRARVAARRARDELLAVEHRRAAARAWRCWRLALGRARARVLRGGRARGARAGRGRAAGAAPACTSA